MSQMMKYWSISSQILTQEALEMGLEVEILQKDKNLFRISSSQKSIVFKSTDFGADSSLGAKICNDKELTAIMLSEINVPIARSIYLDREHLTEIETLISDLPFPVVIKPVNESHGNGVMMHITDENELKSKLKTSFEYYDRMIIQQEIQGDEARFLVVGGEVILAYHRIPPVVIGDGVSTISELITKENTSNPLRGTGYTQPLSHIPIDDECRSYIAKQGYSLESIPELNVRIILRGNSNTGTGGTITNITPIIHESLRIICKKIAKKFNLGICGIDIISSDFSQPLSMTGGVILEINPTPGIGGEKELTGVNTGRHILEYVFYDTPPQTR